MAMQPIKYKENNFPFLRNLSLRREGVMHPLSDFSLHRFSILAKIAMRPINLHLRCKKLRKGMAASIEHFYRIMGQFE